MNFFSLLLGAKFRAIFLYFILTMLNAMSWTRVLAKVLNFSTSNRGEFWLICGQNPTTFLSQKCILISTFKKKNYSQRENSSCTSALNFHSSLLFVISKRYDNFFPLTFAWSFKFQSCDKLSVLKLICTFYNWVLDWQFLSCFESF